MPTDPTTPAALPVRADTCLGRYDGHHCGCRPNCDACGHPTTPAALPVQPDGETAPITDPDLTPTGYLIMETLAARVGRLGEAFWTFPKRFVPALNQLAKLGLCWWENAVTPGDVRVWLTDKGKACGLSSTYESPVDAARRAERALIADELLAWAWEASDPVKRQLRYASMRIAPEATDDEMRAALVGLLAGMKGRKDA